MTEHLHTPRQLVQWAEQQFSKAELCYGHGTDNAHDEAIYLVLRALGLEFTVADSILDTSVDDQQRQLVINLVEKRINAKQPVAYLINEAWFAGLAFYVDERVLIPRSSLAELIQEKFSPWLNMSRNSRILDVGTGSGCIAVACAMAFPHATIDAIDICNDALEVARKNIHRHELVDRIHLIQSDLYENINGARYDLIVANLPYVSESEYAQLPEEYKHEPEAGLKADDDGLNIVKRLLMQTKHHLQTDGILVVEVGNSQKTLIDAYPDIPFFWLDFVRGGHGVFLMTAEEVKLF